jgi:hypothetical protein
MYTVIDNNSLSLVKMELIQSKSIAEKGIAEKLKQWKNDKEKGILSNRETSTTNNKTLPGAIKGIYIYYRICIYIYKYRYRYFLCIQMYKFIYIYAYV